MFSAIGIIPARYGSSRLPGKPLADLQGKPLLYHVYKRACQARSLREVWIATDDERVFKAAEEFQARVLMTRSDHRSGTDRVGEAVAEIEADVVVNIQGDEPLVDHAAIDQVVNMLQRDPDAGMATLKVRVHEAGELWDPNVVKVVTDERDYALYFSRAPIPYPRTKGMFHSGLGDLIGKNPELLRYFYRHVGLYAYRRDFLREFVAWPPSRLELLEQLEQLRALEHGVKIKVEETRAVMFGVDTPEDLEKIRKMVGKNPKLLDA